MLAYRKQNSEKNNYYQCVLTKSSCEHFLLTTTHTKVVNSSSDKMVARYCIRYFFQKRVLLPLSLLEN